MPIEGFGESVKSKERPPANETLSLLTRLLIFHQLLVWDSQSTPKSVDRQTMSCWEQKQVLTVVLYYERGVGVTELSVELY